MGIEITERCQVLRVIACEMSRDHLAPRLARHHRHRHRRLHAVPVVVPGARADLQPAGGLDRRAAHHQSLTRVGGMMADIPDGWEAGLRDFCQTFPKDAATRWTRCSPGTPSGAAAPRASGVISARGRGQLLAVRARCSARAGVDYDVRKDRPYLGYETYDFDVPVGEHGDIYDRYLVRLEEMFQSIRILEQALDRLAGLRGAPVNVDDPRVILPPKSRAMSDMEAMIYHFKQVMEGIRPPVGEAYLGDREPQGRARLLLRLRRHRQAGALAHPAAVVPQPLGAPADVRGRAAVRRDRHQRERRHRDGRDRPMSGTDARPTPTRRTQPVFTGATSGAAGGALPAVPDEAGLPAAGALDGAGGARLDLASRRWRRWPRCSG